MVGSGGGGGGGVPLNRNLFLVKGFLTQSLKSHNWNVFYPISNINKKIPTPGQKLYKRIPFSCHICPLPLLWHEFDNCLCNFLQSKVSCCRHMYFLWRHHLPPDKSENDQDKSLLLCFSFTQLYCFVFHLPNLLLTQNFVYPTLFSSVPPPAINNDRSLRHNMTE